MTSSPITLWQIEGKKVEAVTDFIFLGSKITEDGECSREIKRSCDKPRQCIKKQRHHLANKGPHSQRYGFSSGHVQMWELDHKEGWAPKNWCFWIMVLEKTLESPLDCKEIIGRTHAEDEAPILWPPDAKSWLFRKDPDAGKDWRQEEKGRTEDEMVGWHHWLNGHEFEWTLGDGDGQGGLACYNSWGRKESDMTEWLNWTDWSTGASASASVLPMNSQDWFPLGWTGWIFLQSKWLSTVFSNTTGQKH